jgi:D-alanine--poly(phosphoribitol) ligase subunit 2
MTFAEAALAILADTAETDRVYEEPDLPLYDQHVLDSLKTVELIVALSEALGVEIAPADLNRDDWATPRRLLADLERRRGGLPR